MKNELGERIMIELAGIRPKTKLDQVQLRIQFKDCKKMLAKQ